MLRITLLSKLMQYCVHTVDDDYGTLLPTVQNDNLPAYVWIVFVTVLHHLLLRFSSRLSILTAIPLNSYIVLYSWQYYTIIRKWPSVEGHVLRECSLTVSKISLCTQIFFSLTKCTKDYNFMSAA